MLTAAPTTAAARNGLGRNTNRYFCYGALVVVALAPIPLGSNRPFFWAVDAFVVAALALAYVVVLRADPTRLRVPVRAVALPAALFGLATAWLVVQCLPLPADLLPPAIWSSAAGALGRDLVASISVDPSATVGMLLRQLTYGLLFFLVLQVCANPGRARQLLGAVFWIIAAHAALAILMLQFGDQFLFFPKWAYEGVATGFFVNRNSFATFMAFGLAIGGVLALEAWLASRPEGGSRDTAAAFRFVLYRRLGILLPGGVVIASALVLSASRMGAFSAACGILVAFAVALVRAPAERRRLATGLVLVAILAFAIFIAYGATLTDRLGSIEQSADERLLLYRQVVEMIASRPFTGFGGGTFIEAFPLFHKLPLSADVVWNAAHNLYLELFADLGVFALALLAGVVILVVRLFPALRGRDWPAPAAGLAVAVVAAVHSTVDFSLQIEANVFCFVAILAAGTAQAWRYRSGLRRS